MIAKNIYFQLKKIRFNIIKFQLQILYYIKSCFNMAKKYKNAKLSKPEAESLQKPASSFGRFANRLADAKKKKIQKMTDTQKRVMQTKKNNKMIKITKKSKKFALLDQQDENGQILGQSLTHKGINIKDLKQFDDVNFNQSDLEDQQFDQAQDNLNFAGFDTTNNLLQQQKVNNDGRQKTKTQVYKQIIQKSKAYKMLRQDQYQQNLNMATQLDEKFADLVGHLKFRNKDKKLQDKLDGRDLEYDRLMNELKQDQRVVSNKIIQKNQKTTQRIRKKKNQQLNKLMRDGDSDNDDIRGWVDANQDSQANRELSDSNLEQAEDFDGDLIAGQYQDNQEEQSYDQLDDVNLSSDEADQDNQDQASHQQQASDDEKQENDDDLEVDSNDQEDLEGSNDQGEQQQQEDQQKSQSQSPVKALPTKNNQIVQNQAQPKNIQISQKQSQKKRKLNTIQ